MALLPVWLVRDRPPLEAVFPTQFAGSIIAAKLFWQGLSKALWFWEVTAGAPEMDGFPFQRGERSIELELFKPDGRLESKKVAGEDPPPSQE